MSAERPPEPLPDQLPDRLPSPERLKAYTDAVVAIAQTLLILPLLESVSDARAHHWTVGHWLQENREPLLWLAMSFGLIWMLWTWHHRLFDHIENLSGGLQLANLGWMFGIVFMPIATALLGVGPSDSSQITVYIGTLLFCGLMMALMMLQVATSRTISGDLPPLYAHQVASSCGAALLYASALLLALHVPGLGYFSLLIMLLLPVLVRLLTPVFRRRGWGA